MYNSYFEFRPLTAKRWPQLEKLFGSNGACGNCWCMWWRHGNKEHEAGKAGDNRLAFQALAKRKVAPGILAFAAEDPDRAIGWCAVAPRSEYPRMERSKILTPVDATPVWCISCLYIAKDWRRKGLSSRLIAAAAQYAAANNATVVEGYPFEPKKETAAAFIWTGTMPAYIEAGFTEVARHSPTRPIMRWSPG